MLCVTVREHGNQTMHSLRQNGHSKPVYQISMPLTLFICQQRVFTRRSPAKTRHCRWIAPTAVLFVSLKRRSAEQQHLSVHKKVLKRQRTAVNQLPYKQHRAYATTSINVTSTQRRLPLANPVSVYINI